MSVAIPLGKFQVLLAEDMKESDYLQRLCLKPTWAFFRGLFCVVYGLARLIHWAGIKMGRLSAD